MAKQIRLARVVKNDDPYEMGRVKVLLMPEDNRKKNKIDDDSELPWCFPLLPKMFYVIPKLSEYVMVMCAESDDGESQRFYIGPVAGNLTDLYHPISDSNLSFQEGAESVPEEAPSMNKDTNGILPQKDAVSINGKKNTGIYLNDDDIFIHSGIKKFNGESISQNTDGSEGYLQVGYDTSNGKSITNVVSNYINLFGGGTDKNVSEQTSKTLHENRDISEFHDDLSKIMNSTQQAVYGNKLVEFLEKFLLAFMNHIHPIGVRPPIVQGTPLTALTEYLTSTAENFENLSLAEQIKSHNTKKNPYAITDESTSTLSKEILSDNVRLN